MTVDRDRRKPTFIALVGLVGTVLALAVVETGLRWFLPQPLAMSYRTPAGLTLHIPNATIRHARQEFDHRISINSHGLRDRERTLAKPDGVFRLLVLGDSYPEGAQVPLEETFPFVIERALTQRLPHRRWEVINGGVAGYGTADEIKFFETYGVGFSPDLVVVAFTVGNDLSDNRHSKFFRFDEGELKEEPVRPLSVRQRFSARIKETLTSRFHLVQLLRDRLGKGGERRSDRSLRDYRADMLAVAAGPKLERDWRLTEALLERLRDVVMQSGARLLVAAIPPAIQVEDAAWSAFAAGAPGEFDREGPQRKLAEIAGRLSVPFLDLLPALRAATNDAPVYFRIDRHFNARGHAVAAREIVSALVERNLVPAG